MIRKNIPIDKWLIEFDRRVKNQKEIYGSSKKILIFMNATIYWIHLFINLFLSF